MNRIYKTVVLIVIKVCFGLTIFEWDEGECVSKYQNECHVYLPIEQTTFHVTPSHLISSEIITEYQNRSKEVKGFSNNDELFSTPAIQKKCDKLLLKHRVLLI